MDDAELRKLVPRVLRERAEHVVGLTPTDGFVLSLVDGTRSVDGIIGVAPLGETSVFASIRKLLDAGALAAPGWGSPPAASVAVEARTGAAVPRAAPASIRRGAVASPPEWIKRALRGSASEPLPVEKLAAPDGDAEPLPALAPEVRGAPSFAAPVAEPLPELKAERAAHDAPAEAPRVPGASSVRRGAAGGAASGGEVLEPFVAKGKTTRGTLVETPAYQLLRQLHERRASGVLTIEDESRGRAEIYLRQGEPQYVIEAKPLHRLGEALVRSGLVSPGDVERAVALGASENRRLGLALAQLGMLTEYQLKGILRAMVEVRLGPLFEMERGDWIFVEDARERRDLVHTQIDLSRVLFTGLKANFPWDKARDRLAADQDRFLRRNPAMEGAIPALKLSAKEERFVMDVIDGTKTLRQVLGYSTLKSSATYQIVHALVTTGFLEYAGEALATARESQIAHALERKLKGLGGATHFDVLEVHWTCLSSDVEKAHELLKREYDPTRKNVKGVAELEKMSREILAAVDAAYAVLSDTSSRRAYRRELVPAEKIGFAVEFNLLQAKNHRFTEDLKAMQECLERVKELNPRAAIDV